MRRLNGNYWRLGWVLLVNSTVVALQLTAPIRAYRDQQLLHQVMQTIPPAFSYWKDLFIDPWGPVFAAILVAGVVTEVRRSILSPIFNLIPFAFWLVLAFRDSFYSKQLLVIFPLALVIAVNLTFYALAFRRRQLKAAI
jgi:hypothetical protein